MVLIPAGEFMMGSPTGEGEDDEHPQHKVYVNSFYLDKYEVTNAQYKEFCEATGKECPPKVFSATATGEQRPVNRNFEENYFLSKPDYPVIDVSWFDAQKYAEWVGKRLPTEAEWEYACRTGTTTKYNTGDSISHDDANFDGTGGKDQWDETPGPVGSFPPNAWGLYDMHGNVGEWCSDWYYDEYYKHSPPQNPKGPSPGQYREFYHGEWIDPVPFPLGGSRVARGGGWNGPAYSQRSASRCRSEPGNAFIDTGFRCALDAEENKGVRSTH